MRRLRLLLLALVGVVGFDLTSTESLAATVCGLLVAVVALFAFVRVLLLTRPALGEPAAWRRRLVVGFEVAAVSALLVAVVSALVRVGPTSAFLQSHFDQGGVRDQVSDPELGWAPQGEGLIGMRLDRIDPAREQIIVVGDSIMYGWQMAPEQVAAHLLGERYRRYQVLNASVSGYSIDQYYLTLKRYLPKLRPKVVIVALFSGNDWQVTMREYSWGHSKPLFRVEHGELVRVDRAGACIDHLSQSLLFRFVWPEQRVAYELINTFCKPAQLSAEEGEATIRALLAATDKEIRDAGAEPVFLVSPQLLDYDPATDGFNMYLSYHRALRTVLAEGNYRHLELYPPLDRAEELYLPDHAHYSPAGQQWLAKTLYDYLQDQFHLEQARPGDLPAQPVAAAPDAGGP